MAHGTLLAFRRRHNEDGTWDSICLRCYRTAASARDACAPAFAMHPLCDPIDLHAWMSDREQFGLNLSQLLPIRTPHRKTCRCQVSYFETLPSWPLADDPEMHHALGRLSPAKRLASPVPATRRRTGRPTAVAHRA